MKEKVKPVQIKESVSVGGTLPSNVELVTVPTTWGSDYAAYRYVYWNDRRSCGTHKSQGDHDHRVPSHSPCPCLRPGAFITKVFGAGRTLSAVANKPMR